MSCPTCFARLFVGAAFCPHCGARGTRQSGEAEAPLRCPGCATAMGRVQVGVLSVAECPKCAGAWVDAETFERLCQDLEAQAAVLHTAPAGEPPAATRAPQIRYRPCAACGRLMNRVNFAKSSGVVLDVCQQHGTFFDRDELHRVVRFVRGGGVDRARARERLALAEDERRLQRLRDGAGPAPLRWPDERGWADRSPILRFVAGWLQRAR